MGVHTDRLADSLRAADQVWVYAPPGLGWDASEVLSDLGARLHVCDNTQSIVEQVVTGASAGDQVLVMSNGGFEDIHQRLLDALAR
jgi:UDP-N-acetylmuramate: L-alanyl-gamma-D-glutamyl-meso-diaminopimelate ligase